MRKFAPFVMFAILEFTAIVATAFAGERRAGSRVFQVPDGFEIELVAQPPLVDRPIVADFDESGRLYVADSSGSNDPVAQQEKERPHRIVRLEDTDRDGKFDRRTIFADRMMFPEGTLWYAGSLYVSAPPSIWKLTDADGDGIAESRVEWFKGGTLTGCANDLHGPYLGPDGWIYWCKGAFASQTYDRPGKSPFITRAAHIFRRKPEGEPIEAVMTGGMDNPVDVAFTPGGERIFTTTFLVHPGGGNRDGLIHAIYGGVYGKDHDVITGHPRTGRDLMPVLAHLGPAAPCGLTRIDSDTLGADFHDDLFATLFNMRKVVRVQLEPDGSTFKANVHDFIVSPDLDFHPTDVLEDPSGGLIVVDTGGWYKICCPTSQLVKPDILGGVYRVRRSETARVEDPLGLKLAWDQADVSELAKRLDDARTAVRKRAIETLASRESAAIDALAEVVHKGRSTLARRNAVWTLCRIQGDRAGEAIRAATADSDESVRQAALHAIGVRRDRQSLPNLIRSLESQSPHNRRAAAEAIGRIEDESAVEPLLKAAADPNDRVLEHSLIYALIEIGSPRATEKGLAAKSPATRKAALIALDQIEREKLTAERTIPELASTDAALREAAWWIAERRPEWGEKLAGYFRERMKTIDTLDQSDRDEPARRLAAFASADAIQNVLAESLAVDRSKTTKLSALEAIERSNVKKTPATWIDAIVKLLNDKDVKIVTHSIAAIRSISIPADRRDAVSQALVKIALRNDLVEPSRVDALAAIPGGLANVPAPIEALLFSRLDSEKPMNDRLAAADVLAKARLSADQLVDLAGFLASAGPIELSRLLPAFEKGNDPRIGAAIVNALMKSHVKSSLKPETLRPILARYGGETERRAVELYAAIDRETATRGARLERLLTTIQEGDVRRGQEVFNSSKASCVSCHAIGYVGGKIGPDLTRIGGIRSERDLLESIVYPSASFVRSYEPIVIATREGKIVGGLITRESAESIEVATGPNNYETIPRGEIEEIKPGTVSVMPAGLDEQLTSRQLADLIAFLKACK